MGSMNKLICWKTLAIVFFSFLFLFCFPALEFADYIHKVDMDSILFFSFKKTADFWFLCIYFSTYFGHFVKDVSNL